MNARFDSPERMSAANPEYGRRPEAAIPLLRPEQSAARNGGDITLWHQRPLIQCIASALMPGMGQFMQGRFSTGLYFFSGSTAILMFLIFMVWTSLWSGAELAVPVIALIPILLGWLFFICIGIRDVWQFTQEEPLPEDLET